MRGWSVGGVEYGEQSEGSERGSFSKVEKSGIGVVCRGIVKTCSVSS